MCRESRKEPAGYGNTTTSAEEDKAQDRVNYNNAVATAGTTLESSINRDNAASTSALLGGIGTGLSIGSNYENGVIKAQQSADAYQQALASMQAQRAAQ